MAESLRDKLRRLRREDGARVDAGAVEREASARDAAPSESELDPSARELDPSAIERAPIAKEPALRAEARAAFASESPLSSRALAQGLARRGERLAKHLVRRAEVRELRGAAPRGELGASDAALTAPAPHTDVATTSGAPRALERCARSNVAARTTALALEHAHGAWRLDAALATDAKTLALLAKDDALGGLDLRDALFLDTETTGLSGGAGTYVFLVGLGAFTVRGFEVWQGFLGDPSEERALLAETAERIARAPLLVTFFGKSFDRHRLEDKMRLHGVTPPFANKPHLDLYHPLRRLYGKALPDTRLKTMERALCGVQRPNDLPGSFAPAAWFDFLASRPHRLEGVFAHNHDDVLSLVTLAAHAGRAHELDTNGSRSASDAAFAHEPALRALGLARLLAERKEYARALEQLERVDAGAPASLRHERALSESALYLRSKRPSEARVALEPWLGAELDVATVLAHLELLQGERRARHESSAAELERLAAWCARSAVGRDHARIAALLRRLGPARG
ncbi:MAG: ribonuclease H-like domain-containing protein [Planctomycetes bacterium]|nr:ribonuclease H-like domain-containing protein [Planctomycetota bacterium]